MQYLISAGLTIDVIGFLVIAWAGHVRLIISNRSPTNGHTRENDIWFQRENGEERSELRYRILRLNWKVGVGGILIVMGFVMQLIGSMLS